VVDNGLTWVTWLKATFLEFCSDKAIGRNNTRALFCPWPCLIVVLILPTLSPKANIEGYNQVTWIAEEKGKVLPIAKMVG